MLIKVNGRHVDLDEDGFLQNFDDWSEDIARFFSTQDGLILTDTHMKVLKFMREYYRHFNITPMPKIIVKGMNGESASNKFTIKKLFKLFSDHPMVRACRYAGIPKPTGCT